MISRRQFLFGAIGLAAAPAIVKAENLMKLWVPKHYLEFNFEHDMRLAAADYNLSFWAKKADGDWFKFHKKLHWTDVKDGKIRIDVSQVRDTSFDRGTIHSNLPLAMAMPQLECSPTPNIIVNSMMAPYGRI